MVAYPPAFSALPVLQQAHKVVVNVDLLRRVFSVLDAALVDFYPVYEPVFVKVVVPAEEIDKGKAALTELFNSVKNRNTPIIVERIVTDIDDIVKIVRFDGWQSTTTGKREVKKALRSIVWVKYKIKDNELFNKAYNYVEMYY